MNTETGTPQKNNGNYSESKTIETIRNSSVAFSDIQIREYPIIVGDHPGIMTGVPITIDWNHVGEFDCSIDDYEASKPKSRNMLQLRLPAKTRDGILKGQGFSLKDRQAGLKAASISKLQRRHTYATMGLSDIQEVLEKVKRATLNATVNKGKKKKEREILNQYRKKKL